MSQYNIKSVRKAEEIMGIAMNDPNLTDEEINSQLYDIIDSLLSDDAKSINGSADDFHNFSVTIIRVSSDYETAMEIIQAGLRIHFTNTDLLADAIRYGYNCGMYEDCKKCYQKLQQIPRKLWTWRAFSFSIDYLLDNLGTITDLSEKGVESRIEGILALSKEYQDYFPDNEDSIYSEFEIYRTTNQMDKGLEILKAANEKSKPCPKCWFRYADMLVERNKIAEAGLLIKKLKGMAFEDIPVDFSYVSYLDGVCKMSDLFAADEYTEDEVKKIYTLFRKALKYSSINQNIKRKISQQIERLEIESDIECPFEYNS